VLSCKGKLAILAVIFASAPVVAVEPRDSAARLECTVGPVERAFGRTAWLIYSCDDDRSIIVVSAPGNPANPFIFSMIASGNTRVLQGEGTGSKDASQAAFEDLRRLTESEIASLVAQTKAKSGSK
jgi:hypothetical protein